MKDIEHQINFFIKVIPTSFIRMKENASRLMYQSRQEVEKHKEKIYLEKQKYAVYEIVLSIVVMGGIIFCMWLLLSRQINKANDKLLEASNEQKRLAIEAAQANNAKSIFLANMSHEIRTPLNSIIGFSEILSSSDLPSKEKDYAGIVTRSAKSLLDIINDILDISKIESGNVTISLEPFEPLKVFDQTVELFSVKAKDKNIRFNYWYDVNIPPVLKGDFFSYTAGFSQFTQ